MQEILFFTEFWFCGTKGSLLHDLLLSLGGDGGGGGGVCDVLLK